MVKTEQIDNLDKRILYELDLNSRASASQIARKLRVSKETVNFRIQRLLKRGYISNFYTIFNTSKLGSFYYKVFVKFGKITPRIESEIISFIRNQNNCAYLCSCEGPYDIIFLIMVENNDQFHNFLIKFKEKFGDYVFDKNFHIVINTHKLNQKFLYLGQSRKHSFYQGDIKKEDYDKIDLRIMKIISNNARISLVEIGEKLNLDPKVVKYRIKNLEKKGIIIAYTTALNFDKLGFEFFQINFVLKDVKLIPQIINFFDNTNKCLFALELLGKYDLTIELHVENDKVLRDIMDKFKLEFQEKFIDYDLFNIYKEYLMTWSAFEE
ncbi:MAG: winged helix-turn-helix transcriptional regulator [Candidatus Pacearchaeota archaeon]|jgi:Lrp/AsnC family transcriptional regulator for asnA, asnC and gidA